MIPLLRSVTNSRIIIRLINSRQARCYTGLTRPLCEDSECEGWLSLSCDKLLSSMESKSKSYEDGSRRYDWLLPRSLLRISKNSGLGCWFLTGSEDGFTYWMEGVLVVGGGTYWLMGLGGTVMWGLSLVPP